MDKYVFLLKLTQIFNIIKLVADYACGADVVSKYEPEASIDAGIEKENIIVNGKSKTDDLITYLIENGLVIVADNFQEMML